MSDEYYPKPLASGAVLQAGLPTSAMPWQGSAGLLLRGVVVATYVSDADGHPYADYSPVAVYCDVLTYSSVPGVRWQLFNTCLVTQETGGMQQGHIWKPRAATLDVTGNPLNVSRATNPADLDGDHVLVGFLDNSLNNPIILRGIPHPAIDAGHGQDEVLGARMKLTVADGDPDFRKHHGAFFGISDAGDMVVDLARAHAGALQDDGSEPDPPQDGSAGNLKINIEQNAQRLLSLLDMSDPTNPTAVLTELLQLAGYTLDFMDQTPAWQLKAGSDNLVNFGNKAGNATMSLGDGAKHVPIVEALQQLWQNLKTYLDGHTHPTSTGPSGPPSGPATSWDSSVASSKVAIPDG